MKKKKQELHSAADALHFDIQQSNTDVEINYAHCSLTKTVM